MRFENRERDYLPKSDDRDHMVAVSDKTGAYLVKSGECFI
jgi:hypothetical protein